MSLRKITSLTTLLAFTALVLTGIFTYAAPRGPGSSQWEVLGLGKHEWFALHTDIGILFLVAGIVHTILNIKPIISYLRNKEKKLRVLTLNFNLALLLTLWVIVGSLQDWPPFSIVHRFKENRDTRTRHHPEAVETPATPIPEKPPLLYSGRKLSSLCDKYGIETDVLINDLADLGIEARAGWSIRQIAETNDMKSSSVYETIRQIHAP